MDRLLLELECRPEPDRSVARRRLGAFLRSVGDTRNRSPGIQVLRTVLRAEIQKPMQKALALLSELGSSLENREPTLDERAELDRIAAAVTRERINVLARMRGKP